MIKPPEAARPLGLGSLPQRRSLKLISLSSKMMKEKKGETEKINVDYFNNPIALFVFLMDFAPSFSITSSALIASTFSGTTSDSW